MTNITDSMYCFVLMQNRYRVFLKKAKSVQALYQNFLLIRD